jgi:hypothetical protein
MIEAYMQVDLNNPLAVAYMKHALKSYEIVSDIFRVNVIQCVTPDTLLEELKDIPNQLARRSPQELASIHSNYRAAKRMAAGERFWTLEHDAYLRPEHEDIFRIVMSKWLTKKSTISLGMANEFWTTIPEIAELFCQEIRNGWSSGPMALLHRVTDSYLKNKPEKRDTYWPANRFKNKEWTNKTGVGINVSNAYSTPKVILDSPICQILDQKIGGTVVDRPKTQYDRINRETNPDYKWIMLDSSD